MCPGLVNLGNTCFLNAVLQAVAPCASVCQWLELLTLSKQSRFQYLATTLNHVIKVLNNDSVEFKVVYRPSDVIRALRMHGWVISLEEEDAHEIFHILTEKLNEETSQESSVLSKKEVINRMLTGISLLAKTSADHPFHGLLASQLCCKRCLKCSVKYDTFDSLSLGLPSQRAGRLTLDSLLKQFVMLESVDGVACEKCRQNKKSSRAVSSCVKKLTIGKLPRCLCLHIQRTVWLNNGLPIKRFDRVGFRELLNMSPYMYRKESPVLRPETLELSGNAQAYSAEALMCSEQQAGAYKLTAVIVHLGDISSGHFITYRRAPSVNGQRFPNQWLYTSDAIVKKVPLLEVLAADAYMLFYEKI